jgi:UDP-GlcNAc:undecaprenyl-phosphate/decaprenyl-phosphate GlcNAc-1-phosphate transferase
LADPFATNIIFMPLIFVVTLVLSLLLTPLVRREALRRGLVDQPGEARRVHKVPVPRLGGIAMYAAFATGVLLTFAFSDIRAGKVGNELYETSRVLLMLLGGGIIVAVMAVDDVKRLKPLPRLLWQVGAALLVVLPSVVWPGGANPASGGNPADPPGTIHYDQGAGVLATSIQNPLAGAQGSSTFEFPLIFAVFLTVFWIVGTTNAINWIDGLDGLAASVCAVACGVLFVVTGPVLGQWSLAYLPLLLLAAILGFLPYNLHPARIFMGDSGAMFLGFTLAVLSVIGGAKVAAALLVLGIPILDAAYIIVYRLSRGRSPLSADRGHLHHRLFDIGFSQRQIVLLYVVLAVAFGFIGLMPGQGSDFLGINFEWVPFRLIKLAALIVMVLVLVGIFIFISRRQFDHGPASPAKKDTQDLAMDRNKAS